MLLRMCADVAMYSVCLIAANHMPVVNFIAKNLPLYLNDSSLRYLH